MSVLQEELDQLTQAPGIRGALITNPDGMIVTGSLGEPFREDVVSALTSFLLTTTARTLGECEMGSMTEFVVQCTHGKVMLIEMGDPYLVVLLDQFSTQVECRKVVREAASRLRELTRI